jgi:hypothetical protein
MGCGAYYDIIAIIIMGRLDKNRLFRKANSRGRTLASCQLVNQPSNRMMGGIEVNVTPRPRHLSLDCDNRRIWAFAMMHPTPPDARSKCELRAAKTNKAL